MSFILDGPRNFHTFHPFSRHVGRLLRRHAMILVRDTFDGRGVFFRSMVRLTITTGIAMSLEGVSDSQHALRTKAMVDEANLALDLCRETQDMEPWSRFVRATMSEFSARTARTQARQ